MNEMKEIKLPSGATLKIGVPPFAEARELFQSVLAEMKELNISSDTPLDINFFKNTFCVGFSSKRVESSLNKCLKRSTYNELKIDESVFEDEGARQDYLVVLFEVAQEVLLPFLKNLTALLNKATQRVEGIQK